jgi:uncharacterized protein (TIGR03503 family)
VLIAPDQTRISNVKHNENIAWVNEKKYDLITIKKPESGRWEIDADMDPENQVMIVTDLKFQVDGIPKHIMENEALNLSAYFTDKQKLISRDDFLRLINIKVELTDAQGEKIEWKMQAVKEKAGLFAKTIESTLKKGTYSLKIIADGTTFQRENIQTIKVIDSLISVEQDVDLTERKVNLKLIVDKTAINTESMNVQATISYPDQSSKTEEVEKIGDDWLLSIDAPDDDERILVNFSVMAKSNEGKLVTPNIKPVIISHSLFSVDDIEVEEIKEAPIKVVKKEIQSKEEVDEDDEFEEENEPISWGKTWGVVIGVNIIFMVSGFFLIKMMKKRAAEKQAKLLGRLA